AEAEPNDLKITEEARRGTVGKGRRGRGRPHFMIVLQHVQRRMPSARLAEMRMQEGERSLPRLFRAGLVVRRLVSFAHERVAGPFVDVEVHRLSTRLESLSDLACLVRVCPVVVWSEMRLDGSGH